MRTVIQYITPGSVAIGSAPTANQGRKRSAAVLGRGGRGSS